MLPLLKNLDGNEDKLLLDDNAPTIQFLRTLLDFIETTADSDEYPKIYLMYSFYTQSSDKIFRKICVDAISGKEKRIKNTIKRRHMMYEPEPEMNVGIIKSYTGGDMVSKSMCILIDNLNNHKNIKEHWKGRKSWYESYNNCDGIPT